MKKIAIMGLHLNYGGVESAIVNQANALCDDYEVELAILYKLREEPAFKVDKRVKIKYLTDVTPNREEFMHYLKSLRLIKTFFIGLKSIKILYLKKAKMREYIKNSDADILISSRIEITELLNKYANKDKLTIAEEHCHHNGNKKYLKRLKKACTNIDYLVAVSKELEHDYKKLVKSEVICIPNSLDYWPDKTARLNNKKLVSVGRLSKEKGYSDLIEVFKIIHEKDSDCTLDIIGDGDEYQKIKDKIIEYNLENSVKLHGFQNKEYIHNILMNSSLYLMSSFEESFGIVLIEAGSFGIPQIAFDSAQGANEIIQNNESGYLIKNRGKEQMATKVIELLNDSKKLQEFGKKSREIAQKYSQDNFKKKWLTFLESKTK